MRLGKKKDKERDLEKEQCVEGVARLICSPKQSHPVPLRGKCTQIATGLHDSYLILYIIYSVYRWHRVDWRQVLPTVVAMADACQELPHCTDRVHAHVLC